MKGGIVLRKVNAFAGPGENHSDRFFLDADWAIMRDCGCRTVFTLCGTAFLKSERPLIVVPGERIGFSELTAKEIGWLLLCLANVRGVGRMTVTQASDTVKLIVEKSNQANGQFPAQLNSLMAGFFGFPFRKKGHRCEKCAFDEPDGRSAPH